jgi:tungstate transport system substrate-binding protein
MFRIGLAFLASVLFASASVAGSRVLVQSTTSTQNSGFFDYILPILESETGLDVDVVAVGTGQAIRNAINGDADVLLVHAREAEDQFVAEGWGVERFDLMYNDFVIIGPQSDPAGIRNLPVPEAFARLAAGPAPFVSRGDDSGTHKKELALWDGAGLVPERGAPFYLESGAGMGATIRMAVELGGYTLTDRATWIAYGDRAGHVVLVEGDPSLFNQYGLIAVNPDRHAHVNAEGASEFIDWLLSPRGQAMIAAFRIDGQQPFFPNAARR